MNEIVNKFLLAGDKFMTELQLEQPGSTYSACGPCTRNKDRIQKFKERGDLRYIYQNEIDKTCFRNDKDLPRRTASDKVFCHKAFYNDKNPKYDGYQPGIAQWRINILIKSMLFTKKWVSINRRSSQINYYKI